MKRVTERGLLLSQLCRAEPRAGIIPSSQCPVLSAQYSIPGTGTQCSVPSSQCPMPVPGLTPAHHQGQHCVYKPPWAPGWHSLHTSLSFDTDSTQGSDTSCGTWASPGPPVPAQLCGSAWPPAPLCREPPLLPCSAERFPPGKVGLEGPCFSAP